jgi:aspartate kinase
MRSTVDSIFKIYENLAAKYINEKYMGKAKADLAFYKTETEEALDRVKIRFSGSVKAKVLTYGGELPTSAIIHYIMQSNGIDSVYIQPCGWPIVTDDTFEDAEPNLEQSKNRINALIKPLKEGKVVSMAGFYGVTSDGLETVLGRGGSDLSAVFASCLLSDEYNTKVNLYKDVPVQSADPKVVKGQKTLNVESLTYNEAHNASMMGMKIIQNSAIALARRFSIPIRIVPINNPKNYSTIQPESNGKQIVKCLTGKTGCAILTMRDEKSRSLEDMLRIWERRNDFIDLGAEALETGQRIRDFLFLDSDFLKKNEEKLRGFDNQLKIEYGLGVVTLIGDQMRNSPGIASIAISSIQGINIKRGIFAPHTSQIIIVVEDKSVKAAVAAIHQKMDMLNKLPD